MDIKPLVPGAAGWPLYPAQRAAPGQEPSGVRKSAPVPSAEPAAPAVQDPAERPAAVEPERVLAISIDKETGKTIVHLIDSSNSTVIRQIPTEEMLAIARAIGRMQEPPASSED